MKAIRIILHVIDLVASYIVCLLAFVCLLTLLPVAFLLRALGIDSPKCYVDALEYTCGVVMFDEEDDA